MNLRKVIMALCIPALTIGVAHAQNVEFFKNYKPVTLLSGTGNAVAKTADSNIIMAGTEIVPGEGSVVTLIKTKLNGDTLWIRHYGAAGKQSEAYSITSLSTGEFLVAGLQKDTAGIATGEGMLMRLGTNGSIQWIKTYPMNGYGTALYDLQLLADGYAICGTKTNMITGLADALLIRTNLTGDSLWTKTYGGADHDEVEELKKTPDGGFLLAGSSYSYRSGTTGNDAWLIKTNANGEEQWMKNYGVADEMDRITSLTPAVIGVNLTGYVFTGVKEYKGTTNSKLLLGKIDTAGNLLWDKSMNGEAGFRQGFCIEQAGSEGFYIAATELSPTSGYQMMTIKVDKNGEVVNKLLYGNQESIDPEGMVLNGEGDAFITGQRHAAPAGNSLFLARIHDINKTTGSTAIQHIKNAEAAITVYPNPAGNECIVNSKNEPMTHIRLTDMMGRIVLDMPAEGSLTKKIPLDGLPKGAYLLSVTTGRPNTKTHNDFAPVVLHLTIQ